MKVGETQTTSQMFLVLDLRQEDNGGKYGTNDNNNGKHGVLDPDLRQENDKVSVIKKTASRYKPQSH